MPPRSSRIKHYRSNVKRSVCRGKVKKSCRKNMSCRLTRSGKRKSYCRNKKNTKIRSKRSSSSSRSRSHSKGHRRKANIYENLNTSS